MSEATSEYVTNDAWVRTVGRPDAIDDVADQFERPSAQRSGAEQFWTQQSSAGRAAPAVAWPDHPRGWRDDSGLRRIA